MYAFHNTSTGLFMFVDVSISYGILDAELEFYFVEGSGDYLYTGNTREELEQMVEYYNFDESTRKMHPVGDKEHPYYGKLLQGYDIVKVGEV